MILISCFSEKQGTCNKTFFLRVTYFIKWPFECKFFSTSDTSSSVWFKVWHVVKVKLVFFKNLTHCENMNFKSCLSKEHEKCKKKSFHVVTYFATYFSKVEFFKLWNVLNFFFKLWHILSFQFKLIGMIKFVI